MQKIHLFMVEHSLAIVLAFVLVGVILFFWDSISKVLKKKTSSAEEVDLSNFLVWMIVFIDCYLVIQFYWDSRSWVITSIAMTAVVALETYLYWRFCDYIDQRAIEKSEPLTIVPENTFKMVVKGGDAFRCLLNMDGFVLTQERGSQNNWEVVVVNDPINVNYRKVIPWKFRGKYWSGIFPDIGVAEIEIDRADWASPSSIEVVHAPKKVFEIRTQPERRINLKDLEIGDGNGAGVHLGIELLLMIKNPAKAVFERKGKFYGVIDAGTEQVFAQATLALKTDFFSKIAKSATRKNGLSDLYPQTDILRDLNDNPFIQASGFKVVKFNVKGFEPNAGFTELLTAQRSVAVSEQAAKVKANEVEARAKEIRSLAKAKSDSLESWMETARKHGVDPDVAAEVFRSAYAAEAFSNPNSPISTLFQEGASFGGIPGVTNKNTKKNSKP